VKDSAPLFPRVQNVNHCSHIKENLKHFLLLLFSVSISSLISFAQLLLLVQDKYFFKFLTKFSPKMRENR
jgi:hypothetical protein